MGEVLDRKSSRILYLYSKLISGEPIDKPAEAIYLGVTEKTIQRHLDDIRSFLEIGIDDREPNTVVFDRAEGEYKLEKPADSKLSNSEILALCKILLDSRAFPKRDMDALLKKLISCCVPENNKRIVRDLIRNESFHYVEPRHGKNCKDVVWLLGQAIQNHRIVEIDYLRLKDKTVVTRRVKPAAIMFSEFYFYLAAFIDDEAVRANFDVVDDKYPTIYRADRIKNVRVLEERFQVPYRDRFEEGEFRKRIQFMYGGKLKKIRFSYTGLDVDAILDRLPTASIVSEEDKQWTIEAEVFGEGIDMWIRSQGNNVNLINECDN